MTFAHWFNRHATRLLRNLPRPALRRIYRRPPRPTASSGPLLLIMSRPTEFTTAVWCAWSWLTHLEVPVRLQIVVDGHADPRDVAAARALFPGAAIDEATALVAIDPAAWRGWAGWLARQTFSRKLAVILRAQSNSDVIYADSDILVFDRPQAIEETLARRVPCHLPEPFPNQIDPWLTPRLPFPPNRHFNAGLMVLPRGCLDPAAIERLFADWTPEHLDWTTDQTLFSAYLTAQKSAPLPADTYLNDCRDMLFWRRSIDYAPLTLRHFTGPVRHRLYADGIPWLEANATSAA